VPIVSKILMLTTIHFWLFPHTSSVGFSTLQTLEKATGLDLYHLRAVLCHQLFDTIFVGESFSEDQKVEALAVCIACMRSNNPFSFLDELQSKTKRIRVSPVSSAIPKEVESPKLPVMTQLKLWLLTAKLDEASRLVRRMELCPESILNDEDKFEARISVWQYLLEEGELFLDGNIDIYGYEKKQAFLYEKMVSGVSEAAFETMIEFYQRIAEKANSQTDATSEEKLYVVRACQQTVLRLFIQAYGLGGETVWNFIQKTKWPKELSIQVPVSNLNQWCSVFLDDQLAIPPTLIKEKIVEIVAHVQTGSNKNAAESEQVTMPSGNESAIRQQTRKETRRFLCLNDRFDFHRPIKADESNETARSKAGVDALQSDQDLQQDVPMRNDPCHDVPQQDEERQNIEVLDAENHEDAMAEYEDAIDVDDDTKNSARGGDTEHIADEVHEPREEEHVDDDEDGLVEYEDAIDVDDDIKDEARGGNVENVPEDAHERREQVQVHEDIEYIDSDGENETSEEDLPPAAHMAGEEDSYSDRELNEDDRQFHGEDEDEEGDSHDSYDRSSDAEADREIDSGEEDHESGYEDFNQNVQRGGNEEDAIEIEDSENDSNNDDVDNGIHPDEVDDGGSESTQEEEVVEVLDGEEDDESLDQDEQDDAHVDGDEGHMEMEEVEPDDSDDPDEEQNEAEEDGQEVRSHPSPRSHNIEEIIDDEEHDQYDHSVGTGDRAIANRSDDGDFQEDKSGESPLKAPEQAINRDAEAEAPSAMASLHEAPDQRSVNVQSPVDPLTTVERRMEESLENQEVESAAESGNGPLNVESDATDDEKERTLPAEKAETEDADVGGEFGDTTDEEEDDNMRANRAAEASRRADVLQEGYNSQLGDGYDPEDTHGYTEEDGSEAIHTEDEEEERRQSMNMGVSEAENVPQIPFPLSAVEQNVPHSSDDMDMADEHTEQEDLGAESSELEDAIEGTPSVMPLVPPASAQPKDATTLVEFAQTAQHHHDWKPKSKDDSIIHGEKSPSPAVDIDKDETFDADDEKDVTEGSKYLETEEELVAHEDPEKGPEEFPDNALDDEELVPHEDPERGSEEIPDEALDDDEKHIEDSSQPDHAAEDSMEVSNAGQAPELDDILDAANPSSEMMEEDEDDVDTFQHEGAASTGMEEKEVLEEVEVSVEVSATVALLASGTGEMDGAKTDDAELGPHDPASASPQDEARIAKEPVDTVTAEASPQDDEKMAKEPVDTETAEEDSPSEKVIHAKDNDVIVEEEENVAEAEVEEPTNAEESIEDQSKNERLDDHATDGDTAELPEATGVGKLEEEEERSGDEEDNQERRIIWKKGDIVVSSNPKYLKQRESAKIMKVNEDEEGKVTYDLKFLTSKDRAKKVDPSNIFPYNENDGDDGDDISSMGMNDEASRQSAATPAHGTPRRTRRRMRATAESPTVPQNIEARSNEEPHGESVAEDAASATSTPSRSRRATLAASLAAPRMELSPIAETPTSARGGRPPRPQKTQSSISASQKTEEPPASPVRRSTRTRKRKKFDDDSSVDTSKSKGGNEQPSEEDAEKRAASKKSTARGKKSATKSEELAAPPPLLTRRSTRSRGKKDDEESVASETPSVARAARSRVKKKNDDDQSISSRVSTRSTRSSTRRGNK
jgi:hypothetical protein